MFNTAEWAASSALPPKLQSIPDTSDVRMGVPSTARRFMTGAEADAKPPAQSAFLVRHRLEETHTGFRALLVQHNAHNMVHYALDQDKSPSWMLLTYVPALGVFLKHLLAILQSEAVDLVKCVSLVFDLGVDQTA